MEAKRWRKLREWGKNLLILCLSLSAIWLVKQSTPYEGFSLFSANEDSAQTGEISANSTTQISVEPLSLVVRNAAGRYGVTCDSRTSKELFESQLGVLLSEALAVADRPIPATKHQWQTTIIESNSWIYYDFLSDLPQSRLSLWLGNVKKNDLLDGEARRFLLCKTDVAYLLYSLNERKGEYYVSSVPIDPADRFVGAIENFTPNGAFFAFEQPSVYGALDDNVLLLPTPPTMPAYDATNPLAALDSATREALLGTLDFNPNTATAYETADGWVLKEGSDSLRILKDGTILYQSQGSDEARYPVSAEDRGLLIEQLQTLFTRSMGTRCGEATPYLSGIEETEDGSLVIFFGYRLNGAPVKVFNKGYAARFFVQNGSIRDYTIHLRSYTKTEENLSLLSERYTVAILETEEQENVKITRTYIDTGETGQLRVEWVPD